MEMTVLIVDDNQANLMVLEHMVGRISGCEVVTMTDPEAALQWCRFHEPDLVLTDYMMPGMDGIALVSEMRALPHVADVPIIMVTTSDMKTVRQNALESGTTDFLAKPLDPAETRARIQNLLKLRQAQRRLKEAAAQDLIMRLSHMAESRDPETGRHIERMAKYSYLIARQMGLDEHVCELLQLAAPMHDIGKVAIPDHILLKPGRLEPAELVVMQTHASRGAEFLRGSSSPLLEMAYDIAMTHHEKFDGSGYPNALAGDAIPLVGRIVAVADVFDALTSARPYKPAWPLERALGLLQEQRGKHFDPQVVDAFFAAQAQIMQVYQQLHDGADMSSPAAGDQARPAS
ncbi:HD domain-containing phosphohydrolase [Vogesella oryzae]|uniref:HD domain-containing phosphohydrolase n=1 Tax=Vogesella oryzae TaxID=1735285 RepID=UPI001FE354EF|nr:HD domain-containing phosphohydrolase [Vogesella oryzae]